MILHSYAGCDPSTTLKTSWCGNSLSLFLSLLLTVILERIDSTWEENSVFLFILALIAVANQSSQEWKEMIVHGLLVWLPNEMKHPAAITQGLLVCTFQKYFWHTWKRWAPTYNTEADACVVSNKNCSLWKTFVYPQIREGNGKITAPTASDT